MISSEKLTQHRSSIFLVIVPKNTSLAVIFESVGGQFVYLKKSVVHGRGVEVKLIIHVELLVHQQFFENVFDLFGGK